MTVLICVSRDSRRAGGSYRVAEVLVRGLLKRDFDFHVAVAYGEGGWLKATLGERCHLLRAHNRYDWRGWLRYRLLLKTLRPGLIHYVDGTGWMMICASGLPHPRITHQHFSPIAAMRLTNRTNRSHWRHRGSARVIAISFGVARELVRSYDISGVEVVHNSVDADYLVPAPTARRLYVRLAMAVRVVHDKGIEDALELLRLLPRRFLLSIAGDGPAVDELKSLAKQKGVADRVEWAGLVDDIGKFYERMDFYLFMSWYEGFGLSVAEAMAAGLPVVGLMGLGEISEPEFPLVTTENSCLVPRSRPESFEPERDVRVLYRLRDEILELESDEHARARMATAGRSWIEERFSSARYINRMLNIYRDVMTEHRGAA